MTLWGWIIMLLSVGGTTSQLLWCVVRVLSKPGETEKIHGQIDIRTSDRDR